MAALFLKISCRVFLQINKFNPSPIVSDQRRAYLNTAEAHQGGRLTETINLINQPFFTNLEWI